MTHLISLIFIFTLAFAEEKPETRKEIKLPDFSEVSKNLKNKDEFLKFSFDCTDQNGNKHKKGDAKFQKCMDDRKLQKPNHVPGRPDLKTEEF